MMLFLGSLLLGGVTVTLPMEAHVRGTEIELGEIAQVVGADPEEVDRVAALELGYAPAPGYSRVFVAKRIRQTLLRRLPGVDVRFAGQEACRVFPEVEDVPAAEILAAARAQLVQTLGTREGTFEPVGELPPVSVPAGATERELRARLDGIPAAGGTISVPVDLLVDGTRYRTVWTSWTVRVWEVRAVLARPVRVGQGLRPEMFERRRVLVRNGGQAKPLGAAFLAGAVAVRDLAPGEMVTASDVHRPIVVTLGETLFLRVRKGPIEARVSALALESGAIGDRIRVRTLDSGQELVAYIVSRDLCKIDLGK